MRIWSHAAGYAALVVLVSAGAAESLAGTNTVFTDDIVPGGVSTSDIRENAVTGSRVRNSSLTGSDLALGSVGMSHLGGAWTSPVRETLSGDISGFAFAACPSGQTAISGAVSAGSTSANVVSSVPQGDGWFVTYRNWISAPTWIEVQAFCVRK